MVSKLAFKPFFIIMSLNVIIVKKIATIIPIQIKKGIHLTLLFCCLICFARFFNLIISFLLKSVSCGITNKVLFCSDIVTKNFCINSKSF